MILKQETVGIDDIRPAEKNVRKHPIKQVEALKRSYEMFGQYRPLVVDSDGQIIVGNGMYKALVELGVQQAEVKRLPADFPEDMKKKLMLADNKTQQIGSDDMMAIEELIIDIGDFDIPGFDSDILEDLYGDGDPMEEYGLLPKERVESFKERAEKEEESGSGAVTRQQADAIASTAPERGGATEASAETHSDTYVTCPHCGTKIWL